MSKINTKSYEGAISILDRESSNINERLRSEKMALTHQSLANLNALNENYNAMAVNDKIINDTSNTISKLKKESSLLQNLSIQYKDLTNYLTGTYTENIAANVGNQPANNTS